MVPKPTVNVPPDVAVTAREPLRPCEAATTFTRSPARKRLPRSETGWVAASRSDAVRSGVEASTRAALGSRRPTARVRTTSAFTRKVCHSLQLIRARRIVARPKGNAREAASEAANRGKGGEGNEAMDRGCHAGHDSILCVRGGVRGGGSGRRPRGAEAAEGAEDVLRLGALRHLGTP